MLETLSRGDFFFFSYRKGKASISLAVVPYVAMAWRHMPSLKKVMDERNERLFSRRFWGKVHFIWLKRKDSFDSHFEVVVREAVG